MSAVEGANALAETFRTGIHDGVKLSPNFAGGYVVAESNCGRLPDGTAPLRHFGQWNKVVAMELQPE